MPEHLSPNKIWEIVEPKLTAERLWQILEPRISEYYRFGRFVLWVVGALISLFVSLIVAMLTIPGVKPAVLKTIFDVESQTESYVHAPAFGLRFADLLEEKLSNAVAYSYSVILPISDVNRTYEVPYNKPDKNEGKIECSATYPTPSTTPGASTIRPNIFMWINDQNEEENETPLVARANSHVARGKIDLAKENSGLFAARSRAVGDDPKKSLNQKLTIQVDTREKFEGTVLVTCTITIKGSARLL